MSVIERLISGYPRESVHSRVSLMERMLRISLLLSYGCSNSSQLPTIPSQAGLGTIASRLAHLAKYELDPHAQQLVDSLVATYQTDGGVLQDFRNYLLHGGIAPSGVREVQALDRFIEIANDSIESFFKKKGFRGSNLLETLQQFAPFVTGKTIGDQVALMNYHSLSKRSVTYHTDDKNNPEIIYSDKDPVFAEIKPYIESRVTGDLRAVSSFKRRVERDIKAFKEMATSPEIAADSSPFYSHWNWAQSGGSVFRTDYFRVSASGAPEWRNCRGEWEPYENFLREISNWDVTVKRYSLVLEQLASDIEHAQRKAQGDEYGKMTVPESVSTKFRSSDLRGPSFQYGARSEIPRLSELIDGYATTRNGVHQIFLVSGEAGVGKTFNLLRESKARAYGIAREGSNHPLYLFVDCAGAGTRSLEALIDSAMSKSLNLGFERVSTLSRNGLCVLVLDGFDELLSSSGYSDALSLLGPILDRIGDSGTIIVSARSSYITGQYESSIEGRQSTHSDVPDHWKINLERWSPRDVDELFSSNPSWSNFANLVGEAEKQLLGVPFFAQTFHVICERFKSGENEIRERLKSVGLRSILIEHYLERELGKIPSAGEGEFTVTQLDSIYRETAGMMWASKRQSLSRDDFLLAAAAALGVDEEFKGRFRGLGDRLTSLCGMSVSNEGESLAFAFEHELFYDTFLGKYLSDEAAGSEGDAADILWRELAVGTLGEAAVGSLVESYTERSGQLTTIARRMVDRWSYESHSGVATNLRENISALVAHLMNRGHFVHGSLDGLEFEEILLTDIDSSVSFNNCQIDNLLVDLSSEGGAVSLVSTFVKNLRVSSECNYRNLKIDDDSRIDNVSVMQGDDVVDYLDSSNWVRFMHEKGVEGLSSRLQRALDSGESSAVQLARNLFAKMTSMRRNNFVVESRTNKPGDYASPWLPTPRSDDWPLLVQALIDSGSARHNPINASGSSKARIQLEIGVDDLIEAYDASGLSTTQQAVAFWEKMRGL